MRQNANRWGPPQTELHRHLDVSTRLTTVLELAQKQGLEGKSTSLEAFGKKLLIREPMKDLASVLAKFTFFQKILDTPETLKRVAFEAVEDCWLEGTRKVELRYSPSFVTEFNHLPWQEAHDAILAGITQGRAQYPELKAGLICIASRDYGVDQVAHTVEFFLKNRDSFVGLDLAGNEVGFPCPLFQEAFAPAIQANAKITVHAGEATGPESVWEAIEFLGARRIGHGVTSEKDPKLLEYLKKNSICLELCPTSNWLTQATPHLAQHPLPSLLRQGVPVCLNSDDPGIFGISLPSEMQVCREQLGMTEEEILACHRNGNQFSFL